MPKKAAEGQGQATRKPIELGKILKAFGKQVKKLRTRVEAEMELGEPDFQQDLNRLYQLNSLAEEVGALATLFGTKVQELRRRIGAAQ